MRGECPVAVARELAEGVVGSPVPDLLGMGRVLGLCRAIGEEDAADLAERRATAFDGEKACGDEQLAALHQEVARRALVGGGQEVVGDLGKLGVAIFWALDTRQALELAHRRPT